MCKYCLDVIKKYEIADAVKIDTTYTGPYFRKISNCKGCSFLYYQPYTKVLNVYFLGNESKKMWGEGDDLMYLIEQLKAKYV